VQFRFSAGYGLGDRAERKSPVRIPEYLISTSFVIENAIDGKMRARGYLER
jgi:hypothetical protein